MYNTPLKQPFQKNYNKISFRYNNTTKPYNYYTKSNYYNSTNLHTHNQNIISKTDTSNIKSSPNFSNTSNTSNMYTEPIKNNSDKDNILFEIFGLKIYFDDILIICILLFLYQEGIRDEYLFIALILLLLS